MNTIQAEWELYEATVVPKGAGPNQRQETKRAFYAGAASLLQLHFRMADANLSDEAGAAMLEGFDQECKMFAEQVMNGQA